MYLIGVYLVSMHLAARISQAESYRQYLIGAYHTDVHLKKPLYKPLSLLGVVWHGVR